MTLTVEGIESTAGTMAKSGHYKNWRAIYADLDRAPNLDKAVLASIFAIPAYQRFIDDLCEKAAAPS